MTPDPRGAQAPWRADRVKNLERQHDHALRGCLAEIHAAGGKRSGLEALNMAGIDPLGAAQGPRNVDTQFIVDRGDRTTAIRCLHDAFFGTGASVALVA
jgi:hypothetical protein